MEARKCFARVVAVFGVALFTLAAPVRGQECPEYVDEMAFGLLLGIPYFVEVFGSHAYVFTCGTGPVGTVADCFIRMVDISDADVLRFVAAVHSGPYWGGGRGRMSFYDFTVSEGILYVADSGGLLIRDLSDPADLVTLATIDIRAGNIAVSDGYLFVTAGEGFKVIDVSDLTNPEEVGSLESEFGSDLEVVDGHAYVTGQGGLQIIDVSNPGNPVDVGLWDATWDSRSLAVSEGFAYVLDNTGNLRVIDVSDPAVPFETASHATTGNASRLAVAGSYALVADREVGVAVIDVSNPTQPEEVGRFETRGWAYDVALTGSTAYIVDNGEGNPRGGGSWLWVVDVTVPNRPVETGSLDFQPSVMDIAVSGDVLVVAGGAFGLLVREDGTGNGGWLDTPGTAVGVTPHGDYALVADDHRGLRIIDVSNIWHPVEVGFVDTPGHTTSVAVSGNHAYLADGDAGLRIVDISSPTDPLEVGSIETHDNAVDVAVCGDRVFVAGGAGVHVIDVSDPTRPIELSLLLFAPGSDATTVSVICNDPSYVLGVGYDGWQKTLYINTDPTNLQGGRSIRLTGEPTDVVLSGEYAFVATRSGEYGGIAGVEVVDFSTPAHLNMIKAGQWDHGLNVSALEVSNGRILIADETYVIPELDTRCLTTYWVDIVAHQPGLEGSEWRSDVIISPEFLSDVAVEFTLHTEDGDLTGEGFIEGRQGVFEDIVGLLGYEGKGALEIQAEHPVTIFSRTYNQTDAGTLGQFLRGYRSSDCRWRSWLYSLRQREGEFRTNISFTNTGDTPVTVKVYLYGTDGTFLTDYKIDVGPGMVVQDLQPFKRRAGRPNLGWGYAEVLTYDGCILTSASVIDSRTNDAVTIPMTK